MSAKSKKITDYSDLTDDEVFNLVAMVARTATNSHPDVVEVATKTLGDYEWVAIMCKRLVASGGNNSPDGE